MFGSTQSAKYCTAEWYLQQVEIFPVHACAMRPVQACIVRMITGAKTVLLGFDRCKLERAIRIEISSTW